MLKKSLTIFLLLTIILSLHLIHCKKETILPLSKSWEKAIPHQEIPEGLTSLSAKQCGVCHVDHFNEWKLSTHAHAWTDMQFQAELKKESSPFMCINCHIPLQNQQEYIVTGMVNGDIYKPVKTNNPHFDKSLQQEGITCASCHVRDGAIIGTKGNTNAPHKVIKDSLLLSEKLCISCHNATAVLTPTLACTFETGDEWKAGPYFGKKNCISCHMDSVQRPIAFGFETRSSHIHYFAGSGIPKFDSIESKVKNGFVFYPSTIHSIYTLKDSFEYSLKLKNELAGHKVPTGDPERFFLISFKLQNEKNDSIHYQTHRIGEEWQWYPEAKKIADNNMLPLEERTYDFNHKFNTKGKYKLIVSVTKHRLNQESAEFNKLTAKYPLFISVFNKEYTIEVK